MSEFSTYLELGFDHILDLAGYDHMLFLLALVAAYTFRDSRKLLILITAFTIGHCLTLILAGKGLVSVNSRLVEILIAASIAVTAALNFIGTRKKQSDRLKYSVALFFGLIHGLGFSGFIRALIGRDEVLWKPLLYFNLGVELGQIVFVLIALLVNYMLISVLRLKQSWWTWAISSIAFIWSLKMMIERF